MPKKNTKKNTKKSIKKNKKIIREIAPKFIQHNITKVQIYKPVRGPPSKEI